MRLLKSGIELIAMIRQKVFDGDVAGLLSMKSMTGVSTFAVTIEVRGGRPAPSLQTLQVIGNI